MQKAAGILFTLGAIVAILGEARPVVSNVFGAFDNPEMQASYIQNASSDWALAHLLMGAGALIASFGVVLFAMHVQRVTDKNNVRIASYVSAALAVVGALSWAVECYKRVATPPQEWVANQNASSLTTAIYFLFTAIALILIGFLLLQTSYPKWFAWPMLVLPVLVVVAGLMFGGLPPAVNSLLYLILGIALLLMRSRSPQPSFEPA